MKVQPSDLFPIERCSSRLKTAVLDEFQGRCPTLQEIISISQRRWLTVPGIGYTLLTELDSIIQSCGVGTEEDTQKLSDDTEFLARLERMKRDLIRLKPDIELLMSKRSLDQSRSDSSDLQ
jgi:hypothetical protein